MGVGKGGVAVEYLISCERVRRKRFWSGPLPGLRQEPSGAGDACREASGVSAAMLGILPQNGKSLPMRRVCIG